MLSILPTIWNWILSGFIDLNPKCVKPNPKQFNPKRFLNSIRKPKWKKKKFLFKCYYGRIAYIWILPFFFFNEYVYSYINSYSNIFIFLEEIEGEGQHNPIQNCSLTHRDDLIRLRLVSKVCFCIEFFQCTFLYNVTGKL